RSRATTSGARARRSSPRSPSPPPARTSPTTARTAATGRPPLAPTSGEPPAGPPCSRVGLPAAEHFGRAAEDERREDVAVLEPAERAVLEIDTHLRPALEPERTGALVGAVAEQPLGREDVPFAALPARDPLELAELLERVDSHVGVGADTDADAALADPLDGREAVAEVRLGRRADADPRARLGDEVELAVARVRRVDDRRARGEAAGARQELDRPYAVLGQALVDLPRLLVGVDVERKALSLGVEGDLLEPLGRAGADGVGGEPDRDAVGLERLHLAEVVEDRRLAEALQPAARVGGEQEHDLDARRARRLDGGPGLRLADVVELADGGVAGRTH